MTNRHYRIFRSLFRGKPDKGRQNLKIKLRRRQIRAAMDGNVTMLIWLGKQYLGQREQSYLETIDVTKL